MKRLYDRDIREPLFFFLEETYGKVRFFEEKVIGKSRADVLMVIEHALIGIEIKSDADSYARLKGQVRDYDRYFDQNYIVIGTSHAQHVFEHVPDEWGIITVELVDNRPDFYILRRPQDNLKCRIQNQLRFLWRRELDHIRQDHIRFRYADKSKEFLRKKILEKIPEETLRKLISQELFEREYTEQRRQDHLTQKR